MNKVEVYKMADGTLYEDYDLARVHQKCEKHLPEIKEFIASIACKYNNQAHRTIIERTILAWILWKEDKA